MTDKPYLFLDVDGPLNPWAAKPHRRPEGYTTYRMLPPSWRASEERRLTEQGRPVASVKPLRVWLNSGHGAELLALPFTLVWATTWGQEANEWIGPRIGLPELPVVEWPEGARPAPSPYWQAEPEVYWKTRTIVEYAAGHPFAWVDDEITELDVEYVDKHHDGKSMLLEVSPRLGLLEPDFMTLATWAESIERK